MQQAELNTLFDQQAAGYDKQWGKMAPIRDCLHLLIKSVFSDLPIDANILCVGAGTGAEMAFLAENFPAWRFTAIEPSGAMLKVCRQRAEANGYISRCEFHEGYVDSLPGTEKFDGATCFLVSQFLIDQSARSEFFRAIGRRLKPGGILASSDLTSDVGSKEYAALLPVWLQAMSAAGFNEELMKRVRTAYAKDVAVLPPSRVVAIIRSAGFELPVQFFQAGLIHAWFSKRAS